MITFSAQSCSACGLCEAVCPNRIICKSEQGMTVISDRLPLCFKCGQCMSICPNTAVQVEGLSYDKDFFEIKGFCADENAFYQMIATRRAVRNFKDTPVTAEKLQKIVEAISLAPVGFPPVKTEIVVVQSRQVMQQALPYMVDLYDSLFTAYKNPIARVFIKNEVGKQRFKLMQTHLMPLLRVRLPGLKAGTEDTITRNAPAMILFHADKDGEDISADIVIAATYCMLAAHAMGLGGSIMDLIPPAINKKPELKALFNIPTSHEVVTSVIIGIPKYQYQRGIKRNLKSVQWV